MTKASPTRLAAKGKVVPTTLTVSDEVFAPFEALGLTRDNLDGFVNQEQARGTSQDEFDTMLKAEGERATAAHKANEEAKAKAEAEQRAATRSAFAGMALQGILAGPLAAREGVALDSLAELAVYYADAVQKALDKLVQAD